MKSQQLEHQSKGVSVSVLCVPCCHILVLLIPLSARPCPFTSWGSKVSKIKNLYFLASIPPCTASISSKFLLCLLWRLCSHLRVGAVKLVGTCWIHLLGDWPATGRFFLLSPPESLSLRISVSERLYSSDILPC